jgi:protein ImuB
MDFVEIGLARPTWEVERIRPLLAMKLPEIDAGFGIDMVRLEAPVTEPLAPRQHAGHAAAAEAAAARLRGDRRLEDLIGRIGTRIGLEAITRRHPGDSHVPEKAAQVLAAAWSDPAEAWPAPPVPRPLMLWPPEPVQAPEVPQLPDRFRWRRQEFTRAAAVGPERIAPEWWLDDPAWRSGVRDYWRVTTTGGTRLWLYFAHGGTMSAGWFCQGEFA